jgi:hypothetical protein
MDSSSDRFQRPCQARSIVRDKRPAKSNLTLRRRALLMTTGIDWSYAEKGRADYMHRLATLCEARLDDTKLLDFNSMVVAHDRELHRDGHSTFHLRVRLAIRKRLRAPM